MKTKYLAAGMGLALTVAAIGYKVGRARADGVPSVNPLFYSGLLEDGGRPVEGSRDITLRLWDAANGGTIACPETTAIAAPVLGGRFRVALDTGCVGAIQRNRELWTEVVVGGTSLGRGKVGAVPFAIEAGRAAGASGMLESRLATVESRSQPRQIVTASNGSQAPGCDPTMILTNAPRVEITPRTTGLYRLSLVGLNNTNCNCVGIAGIAGSTAVVASHLLYTNTSRPTISTEGFLRLESGRAYVFGVGTSSCSGGSGGSFTGQLAVEQAE